MNFERHIKLPDDRYSNLEEKIHSFMYELKI